MTEAEAVRIMREHWEGCFPKVCSSCKRRFETLYEYLLNTTRQGSAISYDAESGDWEPLKPVGMITFSNCRCGNTLALSSSGMQLSELWRVLDWVKNETRMRRVTPRELLNYLRDEICKQLLAPGAIEND